MTAAASPVMIGRLMVHYNYVHGTARATANVDKEVCGEALQPLPAPAQI